MKIDRVVRGANITKVTPVHVTDFIAPERLVTSIGLSMNEELFSRCYLVRNDGLKMNGKEVVAVSSVMEIGIDRTPQLSVHQSVP
jgi:hypothetical protein